jgi:Asp-tRNA(Asn)/Glu-tRNA(Gln) amidotransferase A subunit family amidase
MPSPEDRRAPLGTGAFDQPAQREDALSWPTVVRRLRQAGAVIDGSALVCSIRIPAGFCGLYGLKPSAGIVSLTVRGWAEIAPLLPTSGRPGRR